MKPNQDFKKKVGSDFRVEGIFCFFEETEASFSSVEKS
jgi:hypothetical protein